MQSLPVQVSSFKVPVQLRVQQNRFTGGGTGGPSTKPDMNTESFRKEVAHNLEKQGLPAKKPRSKWQRGIASFWLILAGTLSTVGSGYGIHKLIQGPDDSAYSPQTVALYHTTKITNDSSPENMQKTIQSVLMETPDYQKLDAKTKENIQQQSEGVIKELYEIKSTHSRHNLPYVLLTTWGGILGLAFLAFGILRAKFNEDDGVAFMKHHLSAPKRLFDHFRKEQYEIKPLDQADLKAMAEGIDRITTQADVLIQKIRQILEKHPDIREHLNAAGGPSLTAEGLIQQSLAKSMEALLSTGDSGAVQHKPWTQTRQINERTLLSNLEEFMQDIDRTGYLLEAFIPSESDEIAQLRKQDSLSSAERKTLSDFDNRVAQMRIAHSKMGLYHIQERFQQAEQSLQAVNDEMTVLCEQQSPEAETKLLALNLRQERAKALHTVLKRHLALASHLLESNQQALIKLNHQDEQANDAALQRMLQRQEKGRPLSGTLEDTLERLAYENQIASLKGNAEGPSSPEDELSRIKAEIILKQQLADSNKKA